MYGTNNPGETLGVYDNTPFIRDEMNRLTSNSSTQRTTDNMFQIGQDYKIDIRVHGRFINLLLSDFNVNTDGTRVANPNNMAMDTNLMVPRGISWNISGMQAEIQKGGRR